MLDLLSSFVVALRQAGLPVSLTEHLDAAEAIGQIPLEDRPAFKAALGATLVKQASHQDAFDTVFDVWFALRGIRHEPGGDRLDLGFDLRPPGDESGDGRVAAGLDASTSFDEALLAAMQAGDEEMLKLLASLAVQRFAGMEAGRPVGGSYYLFRVLRHLELDGVVDRLVAAARGLGAEQWSELDERLARDEATVRVDRLRAEIEAEIRRRLVADRGPEAMARTLRRPLPEDVDFMHAGPVEMAQLRKALGPLTRKLAARLAEKRRHQRRGTLDFRSTIRHSLSYGGVPADPRFRHARPAKPEIFVVADVSGSVAAFARFTLQLVHAISGQFSKVRSFVFIDGIDEVTWCFEQAADLDEAVNLVNGADVVWADGHSDYGHALERFTDRWADEIGPRTTVLVLGDARNNYHAARADLLGQAHRRAKHLYWLNPEPRSYWDTGDSLIGEYSPHTDGVYECRNLRQLERFVRELD